MLFCNLTPAVMFLGLFSRDNVLLRHLSKKLIPMKSIQEHLRQLLQTVPTSKMLQVPLCMDALFEHFKQSANKPSSRCLSKSYIAPPQFNIACLV